jgi:hypothetical protein
MLPSSSDTWSGRKPGLENKRNFKIDWANVNDEDPSLTLRTDSGCPRSRSDLCRRFFRRLLICQLERDTIPSGLFPDDLKINRVTGFD